VHVSIGVRLRGFRKLQARKHRKETSTVLNCFRNEDAG
jgi:hypothetical protein